MAERNIKIVRFENEQFVNIKTIKQNKCMQNSLASFNEKHCVKER